MTLIHKSRMCVSLRSCCILPLNTIEDKIWSHTYYLFFACKRYAVHALKKLTQVILRTCEVDCKLREIVNRHVSNTSDF